MAKLKVSSVVDPAVSTGSPMNARLMGRLCPRAAAVDAGPRIRFPFPLASGTGSFALLDT
ncbi:MAG: hypothetical protein ACUVQQ_06870 [Thermogutta sp.]